MPIVGCILVPHGSQVGYPIAGNTSWPLNGFEADWIVERASKSFAGGLYNLPHFTSVPVTASVGYNNGTAQASGDYSTKANVQWQMYSGVNQLARVTGTTSSTMLFDWLRSN
jgi:hypothetical protein